MTWEQDYTLRVVVLGATLIGATSGVLGSFALLRRQSLLGDAVAHCALPGIALAFLLTGRKELPLLLLGAGLGGWLGAAAVAAIDRRTRLSYDAALGLILSVFFGIGLVLLTFIQRLPNAAQAGLDRFLFGQAATLVARDVVVMAILAALAVVAALVLWKEWALVSFDHEYAAALGLNVRWIQASLMIMLVLAVTIGLQAVGVVLMSALIVAPAAAARQWTQRLGPMVLLAAGLGALAGGTGAAASALVERLPTGPTIVLVAAALVVVSLLFGRERGVLWRRWRAQQQGRRGVRADAMLLTLYDLAVQHDDVLAPHAMALIESGPLTAREVRDVFDVLESRDWALRVGAREWALTPQGVRLAQALRAAAAGSRPGTAEGHL